jgi:membrane protease subunit HflK
MSRRTAWLLLLAGCGLALAATGIRAVRPGERIVVRRFGRLIEPPWGPGLHCGLPLGIDRFDRVRTDEVRRLIVGTGEPPGSNSDPGSAEFLSGDLNLVQFRAVVQYRVSGPGDLLVRSADFEELLGRLAESRLSCALARRGIDAVLREDRPRIGAEVARELAQDVARHRLGVEILGVSLTDARPPIEVAADFSAAQSAESLRDRRGNEARTTAETTVTAAQAKAQAEVDTARGAAQRKLLTARAQAQRFRSLLTEAERARTLTVQRIYLDAMQSLLGGVRRRIILPPGDAVDLTVLGIED